MHAKRKRSVMSNYMSAVIVVIMEIKTQFIPDFTFRKKGLVRMKTINTELP